MRVIAVPRELKPTSPAFLRGHYSAGVREAAAMRSMQRRSVAVRARCRTAAPLAMGAGQAALTDAAGRPPQSTEYRSGQATGRAGGCNSLNRSIGVS
jgi:hypothetical protein